jgi:uncharacterized protein
MSASKYYAVFLRMISPELSQQYRTEHLDYLAELGNQGKIFAKGRFVDGAGGLVIYIADSEEEVKALVEKDPYIIYEARSYEIHEWDLITDAVLPNRA